LELNESSCRTFLVAADGGAAFADEFFAGRLAIPLVGTIAKSVKKRQRLGQLPQSFLRWLTLSMLIFGRDLSFPLASVRRDLNRIWLITF
jgi:hypothetical protein